MTQLYQSQQCLKQSGQGITRPKLYFIQGQFNLFFYLLVTYLKYDFPKHDAKTNRLGFKNQVLLLKQNKILNC